MGLTCIADGPDKFGRSCCCFVEYKEADARLFAARCRQREEILIAELEAEKDPMVRALKLARLQEVQAMVIFCAVNCKERV